MTYAALRVGTTRKFTTDLLPPMNLLLAVLMPPLSVFLKTGSGRIFWLNVLLTLLAYLPGVVHALWIVTRP